MGEDRLGPVFMNRRQRGITMRKLLLAAVLVMGGLVANATIAQEGQELTPEQEAEGRQTLEIARNLASYGEAKGDALALVMAAKMMAELPGRVLPPEEGAAAGTDAAAEGDMAAGEDAATEDEAAAEGEAAAPDGASAIEDLLTKAEEMAPDDETITALVEEVRATAEEQSRAVCYWEYYCYWNGYCEYAWACF